MFNQVGGGDRAGGVLAGDMEKAAHLFLPFGKSLFTILKPAAGCLPAKERLVTFHDLVKFFFDIEDAEASVLLGRAFPVDAPTSVIAEGYVSVEEREELQVMFDWLLQEDGGSESSPISRTPVLTRATCLRVGAQYSQLEHDGLVYMFELVSTCC